MKEISCDIIQDLLPLYEEQMLSDDSIQLVEGHLKNCEKCKRHLDLLRQDDFKPVDIEHIQDTGSKNAFKNIKRRIAMKRLLAVVITAVVVLCAIRVGYYFYAEKGTYVSWEDSGLEMKGDQLYATKPYTNSLRMLRSADQHTMFLIMVDTPQSKHLNADLGLNAMIINFADQIDPAEVDADGADEDKLSGIEQVYYLPAEYANFQFDYESEENWQAQSQEAISKSILLWEK